MSEYRWVPDFVCHGVCPRDANLHALEVPGDRVIVFTAADCPHCRAEKAERERDEARPVLEAARQQAKAAENLGTPVSLEFKCEAKDDWLITAYRTEQRIEEYDAARASAKEAPEPTDQQHLDTPRLDRGGETRGER